MYYRPRFYRRNPYSFLTANRGSEEEGFGPGPGFYPGGFGGGWGSFIVGGLAGAFLASAFGNKNAQATQPVPAQATPVAISPVIQPVSVAQGGGYNYSPYGYMAPTTQLQEPKVQENDEDEELYPDFDEWKGKQPVKETHQVYTIPNQTPYMKVPTYQAGPMYYQGMAPAYQTVQQPMMAYQPQARSALNQGRWVTTDMVPYQEGDGSCCDASSSKGKPSSDTNHALLYDASSAKSTPLEERGQ